MKISFFFLCFISFYGCKDEIPPPASVSKFDRSSFKVEDEIVFDSFTLTKATYAYKGGNGQNFDSIFTKEINNTGLELIIPKSKLENGDGLLIMWIKGKPKVSTIWPLQFEIFNYHCIVDIPISRYKKGFAHVTSLNYELATIDGIPSYLYDSFQKGIPIESYNKVLKLPYKGGNGQTYYSMWAESKQNLKGVIAYTKTGKLNKGNGEIEVFFKGTPLDTGIASCELSIGGYSQNIFFRIKN